MMHTNPLLVSTLTLGLLGLFHSHLLAHQNFLYRFSLKCNFNGYTYNFEVPSQKATGENTVAMTSGVEMEWEPSDKGQVMIMK